MWQVSGMEKDKKMDIMLLNIEKLWGKNSMNKIKKYFRKNKAGKQTKVFFITAILMASLLITSIELVTARTPHPIIGYASYCSGGYADGAKVYVNASSIGKQKTTWVGPAGGWATGYWQVDVGDPDVWPTGTPFTVQIVGQGGHAGWFGSTSGTVSGYFNDMGTITLNPPTLIADANANPTIVVVGETVYFTGSATGGATPYSWSWNFGDGQTSNLQNPTHSYSTTGTKTVVLTVTDTCVNTDTDTVVITVNPALSCDANGPYTGTICSVVQFAGTATGGHPPYTYSWTFGDGGSGSGQNPTHQYTSDGSYTATLTVTDSQSVQAVDTAPVTITTPALVAEAGGPYTGTICNAISFSGSASGGCTPYSYSWAFGDGGSGSGQNPTHQYTADGSYTATVTVTDNKGSTDTDTASVTISTPTLVAEANGPYNGYTGIPIDFEGSATGGCTPYTYSWNFGDGGTSNQQNPTHSYSSTGVFTVTLTVTDNKGYNDVDTTTATILASGLDVDAGGPYYGEVNVPIQFNGVASKGTPPYSYQWNFGDGGTSNQQNPTHAYSEPSSQEGYQVALLATDSKGVNGYDYTHAYVSGDIEEPTANANGPYQGKVDETIQFTGSVFGGTTPYSYSWDFDDNDGIQVDSTLQNPTFIYGIPGVYNVTLTVTDDNGKTDDDKTTATISELMEDLECEGTLSWTNIKQGTTVNGSFTVRNNGGQGTKLNWEVNSYPDWGTWTFTPSNGSDLTPEAGIITVQVTILAPKAKSISLLYNLYKTKTEDFTGNMTIINKDNPSDKEVIPVSITVSKSKAFTFLNIYEYLIYRFPLLEKILNLYYN